MSTVTLNLEQSSPTAMKLDHDVQVIVDRPSEQGGGGSGLMGGQYMLVGIGGCFCSTLFAAAQARDIEITGLTVKVEASLSKDLPKRFDAVTLKVKHGYCSHPGEFAKLLKIAEQGCLSINTIKTGMDLSIV
ncbi:MAG: OsmC family protein [Saprospiraceae bacterium]|nr:OsmC family protein [Saprospiraceae bacterium]